MQVSWCRPWGTLPSGQVNNSRNLMLFPVCHGNIQKVSRGAERSPGLRLFGKPNKKVCPQIFEKKKKKICGQTFHFLPLFSTSHIASKFNWRSQSFIFMFSRKQMFSPVCPIRKKKKKKNLISQTGCFIVTAFLFFLDFLSQKLKSCPRRERCCDSEEFSFCFVSLSRQMEAGATKQMFWCEILKIAVCPTNPPLPNNPTLCDYSTLQKP